MKYIINLGMIVSFLGVFITGIVKYFIAQKSILVTNLGLPLYQINTVHQSSGITLGFLIILHLMLNGKWVIEMTKNIGRGQK